MNDESREQLLASIEPLLQKLRIHLRHIVGLGCAYEHVDGAGAREPQQPLYFTGVVIDYCGDWYLLTAGHVLEDLEATISRPDVKLVACGLDDTHGPSAKHAAPIHYFDFESAPRFFVNRPDSGLDFGLVHIRPHFRHLLHANGIEPLTAQQWSAETVHGSDVFVMFGFPEDSSHRAIDFQDTIYVARAKARPSVVLLERRIDIAANYGFVGQIDRTHDNRSIVGMSGGPILGFKDRNFDTCYVAAIQSRWRKQQGIVLACPFVDILAAANDFLKTTTGK